MARPRDKACSLCTLTKPRAAFAAKGENGLQSWCRQCTSEWNRWKRDPKGNKKPGPLSEPKPPEPDRRLKEHQEPAAKASKPAPFMPHPAARPLDSYQMLADELETERAQVSTLTSRIKELETQLKLAPKVDAVAENLAAEARDLRNDKARLTRELGTAEGDLRRARDRNASLEEQIDLAAKKLNEAYARVGELEEALEQATVKGSKAVAVVPPEHQIAPGPQQPLLSGDHAVVRGDDLMTMIQQLAGAKADAAGFNVERPYLLEKIAEAEAKAKTLADELEYKDMELADLRAQIAALQIGTPAPVEPAQVVTSQEGDDGGPKAEAVAAESAAPAPFQEVLIPQSVEPDDSTRQYMPVAEAAPDELTEIACDEDEPVGEREGDHLLDAAIALESSSRMDKADLTPKLAETARTIIWKLVDAGWKRDKALKTVVDFAFLLLSMMPSNQAAQNGLLRAIGKILLNPHTAGKFLTGHQYAKRKNPVHRVRAGNYRLDYEIRKDGAVVILFLGHKADSEGFARQRQINAGQGYLMEIGA